MDNTDATGLTRRATAPVRRVFDEDAPTGARVRAGGVVAVSGAAALGAVAGTGILADHIVTSSHALAQLIDPSIVPSIGVVAGVNVLSGLAWATCPDRKEFAEPLATFHRRVGVGVGIVAAASATVAAVSEIANLDGVHGAIHTAVGATAVTAATTLAAASSRGWGRIWGGPKQRPPAALTE